MTILSHNHDRIDTMATLPHTTNPYETLLRCPAFIASNTGKKMPNDTGWQTRHLDALRAPRGFEVPIVSMLVGWASYADTHAERHESKIGDDYVLGVAWRDMGLAIHALLDGETGRLDCGTLSSFIHDALSFQGFES